jgi:EpsI family protein
MTDVRFLTAVAILLTVGWLTFRHGGSDVVVQSEPLSGFPTYIGERAGDDQTIDQETLEVLGNGEFIERIYSAPAQLPLTLFVAYFPSQRTGSTMHSPRNCLPGAGWSFLSSQRATLRDYHGTPHSVGEYIIAQGDQRQFVIYWYHAHGRSVAGEYSAKFYLILDAIRTSRTDGALVRITTPIGSTEEIAAARLRAEEFAIQILPRLSPFIPD